MITDRTIDDVKAAIALKKRGLPFTESELTTLKRGTLCRDTLDRINEQQMKLLDVIPEAGYYIEKFESLVYVKENILLKWGLEDYIVRALTIKNAFPLYKDTTPDYVEPIAYYEEINKLEQILEDLWEGYLDIETYSPECNAISSGGYENSVSGVKLSMSQINLMTVGETCQLIATVSPSTAIDQSVTWSSSNSAIVSVSDSGLITAMAASSGYPAAIITVTTADGGYYASCAVVKVE